MHRSGLAPSGWTCDGGPLVTLVERTGAPTTALLVSDPTLRLQVVGLSSFRVVVSETVTAIVSTEVKGLLVREEVAREILSAWEVLAVAWRLQMVEDYRRALDLEEQAFLRWIEAPS